MNINGQSAFVTGGGSGLGAVEAGIIMEAMGRNLSAAPMLSTALLGATALVKGGTPEQQASPHQISRTAISIVVE